MARPQLIDLLAQNESISASQLDRAVRLQQERAVPLAEVLVWEELLHEDDIFFLLQRALGLAAIPEERLLHLTLSPEIRRRVPRSFARAQLLVPLDLDINKGLLAVAMFDPSDASVMERLRNTSRVADIRPYLARRSSILNALKTVYTDSDEFRDGEPEWLRPGKSAGAGRAAAAGAEAKVEIDPGLVEELEVLSSNRLSEPLRSIRVRRPQVFRAAPAPEPTPPSPPPAPAAPQSAPPGAERRARSAARSVAAPATADLDEEQTEVFELYSKSAEQTAELEIPAEMVFEPVGDEPAGDESQDAGPFQTQEQPVLEQFGEDDSLLRELLSSVGVLVSMLEERIDPSGGACREYGRMARLVARELDLDELSVARLALAAQLYGLDLALRRELGITARVDVKAAFASQPTAPGGLGPSLRSLGARALCLEEDSRRPSPGPALVGLVADYLELRAESEENVPDPETVAQLLRAGGADQRMVDALLRALESLETAQLRVGPGGSG